MKMMSQLTECPICQSGSVTIFLRREGVPVHQNLVMGDQYSAVEISRGDLSIAVCEQCGFVFNQAFESSNLSYGENYDNTQSCSPAFDEYLSGLARYLVVEQGVQDSRIVEVGCGKGLFLRKLITLGKGNVGYGFDPSYVGPTTDYEGRLRFERRYYGPECATVPADVVVCRHVLEHVSQPIDLLRTIRQALASSPQAKVFFETPDVEWILRNQVIWDFFYEHCSYFSAGVLMTAFEASGFKVERIQPVFGEQYLWLEATMLPDGDRSSVTRRPGLIPQLARKFAASENELERDWKARIQELAARGRVALWGAGAKGVTFANLIDPEMRWIDCVVDLNPQKQGRYLPGTGHPIVGYQELVNHGIRFAILMNPNYRTENVALLREAHLEVELIDLMELRRQ